MFAVSDIAAGVAVGNFLNLAKTISQIENQVEGTDAYLMQLEPKPIPVVGITGPPGAGKSTLISALVGAWIRAGHKVAVLSVDPSSPFHKGAILGDRIRMKDWYLHPQVFIRSLASRGHLGGLNSSMIELTTLLQSVGFDQIIVETVGVGQSEVEIAGLADKTLVVLVPESGDEIQHIKSGLMEIAQAFVVNKADREGADTFANNLKKMVHQQSEVIPIFKTVAEKNIGISLLCEWIAQLPKSLNHRKNFLMAEKALRLIQHHRMKGIDQKKLRKAIDEALVKSNFNIYKFVEGWLKHS